jgi:hypothetical protein
MNPIVVLLIVIVALFVGSFLSKRRFGILGLGLAAGAVISPILSDNAGFMLSATGLIPEGPLINAIATSVLILLPAVLFMFHGPKHEHIVARLISSLLFMMLAIAFLIQPIGSALTFTGPVGNFYQWFVLHRNLIIGLGVALAVADQLIAKASKSEKKRR